MKKILIAMLLSLAMLPAWADYENKPDDVVGLTITEYGNPEDPAIETRHETVSKPWKDIKLKRDELMTITHYLAALHNAQDLPDRHFRIVHLTMVDNEMYYAVLLSEYGTTVSVSPIEKRLCFHVVFTSNKMDGGCYDID